MFTDVSGRSQLFVRIAVYIVAIFNRCSQINVEKAAPLLSSIGTALCERVSGNRLSGTRFDQHKLRNAIDNEARGTDGERFDLPKAQALQRRTKMRILRPTILALTLTMMVSSSAFAGNIAGLKTSGNIGGTRSAGNIGGTRSTDVTPPTIATITNPNTPQPSIEGTISSTFAVLIRMLLESGALL
jgi:hypothetical protein